MSVILCNSLINKLCSVFFISEHFTVFKSVCNVRNVQPCLEWLWQEFKQKAHLSNDILVNVSKWKFKGSPMCAGIPLPPSAFTWTRNHIYCRWCKPAYWKQYTELLTWARSVTQQDNFMSHSLSCNKTGLKIKGRRNQAKTLSGVNWLTCFDFIMNWNLNCHLVPSVDNLIHTLIYKLTSA